MMLGQRAQGLELGGVWEEVWGWKETGPASTLILSQALTPGFLPQEALLGSHSLWRYDLPCLLPSFSPPSSFLTSLL